MSVRGSALLQVVTQGDEHIVASCIANGADVNARNDGGQTPLILAIVTAQPHLLRQLLKAGANPFLRDNSGLSAIDWAERKGRSDLARILFESTNSDQPNDTESRPQVTELDEPPRSKALAADEKSRKFLAGLKQRLEEKADRRQVRRSRSNTQEDAQPEATTTSRAAEPMMSRPSESLLPEIEPVKESVRKRCPECNKIYTSDLLAYCAYHVVPLVDADQPIVAPKQKTSSILLWVCVLITVGIALVAGLYLTNLLFRNHNNSTPASAAAKAPTTRNGIPVLGRELNGKAATLPQADPPAIAVTQPASVAVQVKIDKTGKVISAVAISGERSLREVAVEAAKKSTFSVEKLQARGTAGTITYTFNP